MIVVLDASAAVRAALDPSSPFHDALSHASLVIAPDLVVAEICSAMRKYIRAGQMTRTEAERSIGVALALIGAMQPMTELVSDVLHLVARLETSVYDSFYLALALRKGAVLLTADRALHQTAMNEGVRVTMN